MCKAVLVPIPLHMPEVLTRFDATHPEYGYDTEGRKCFRMDGCIVEAVKAVWAGGFKTLGCCCGHGSGHGVISLDLGLFERPDVSELLYRHHCSLCGQLHENVP